MLHHFGRFFDRENPDFSGTPVDPNDLNLLGDHQLETLVTSLEAADSAERYPLQVGFYQTMMACHLLLPIPLGTDLRKGLPIVALQSRGGEKAIPVFTSEQTMSLWIRQATDYVVLPFATVCRYAMEAGADFLVLNAAGPYGCEIAFHDFAYLAEGLLPPPSSAQGDQNGQRPGEVVIEKNTPMRLSHCAGLSDGLMDRLQHVFRHHQNLIERVYLFDVAFNEGPLQPALGISMPEGSEELWEMELWPNMQAVLYEMLERREVVNVFLLNQTGGMEHHVQQLTPPIYESRSA